MCARLAAVADVHAPSRTWHVHTLLALLAIAGNAAKREVLSQTLFLIAHAEGPTAHAALAHALYCHLLGALGTSESGGPGSEAQQPLLQAAVWVVGEYGHALAAAPPADAGSDGAVVSTAPLGAALPAPAPRSDGDVVRTLARVLRLYYATPETRAMVLTALLKLTARCADAAASAAARALLAEHATSSDVELQTRAVEYGVICAPGGLPGGLSDPARVKAELLAPMPLLEEGVLRARAGAATGAATDARTLAGDDVVMAVAERSRPKAAGGGGGAVAPAAQPPAAAASGGNNLLDLDSLFGSVSATAGEGLGAAASPAAAAHPQQHFGGGGGGLAAPAPSGGGGGGDIGDLFGLAMAAPAPAPAPASSMMMTAAAAGGGGMMMMAMGAPAAAASRPAAPTGMAALDDLFGAASLSVAAPAPAAARPSMLMQPAGAPAAPAASGSLDDLFGAGPVRAAAPAPPAAAPAASLSDLFAPAPLAAAAPAASAATSGGFGDFEVAAAAAPPFSLPHTLVAYENAGAGLRIVMRCDKPSHASPLTDITASFTVAAGHRALHGFACQVRRRVGWGLSPRWGRLDVHRGEACDTCGFLATPPPPPIIPPPPPNACSQAAVPKFAKVTLMPASGTTLAPGGAAVTQLIKVENSAQGAKPRE